MTIDGAMEWKRIRQTATGAEFELRLSKIEDADGPSSISPQERRGISEVRKMFGTVVGRGHVTRNGDAALAQISLISTRPSVPAMIASMIVPLPAEPIGVHARWRVKRATSEVEFEVLALSGDTLVLSGKERSASRQIDDSHRVTERSELAVTIDLTDPLPTGALSVTLEIFNEETRETTTMPPLVFEIK
jgi:hypothetical protein